MSVRWDFTKDEPFVTLSSFLGFLATILLWKERRWLD